VQLARAATQKELEHKLLERYCEQIKQLAEANEME
jgi:hypothetical protein